jgi:hypothetical protein
MIRGGGRSRKALDAKEESEDEDSSQDLEAVPEGNETLTPTTPAPLAPVHYLQTDQASVVSQAGLDGCRYVEHPTPPHLRPPESKDNYQDHRSKYSLPVEVNPSMREIPDHGTSGQIFDVEAFANHSYGTMQDVRSHGNLFPPSEVTEQPMMGQWAITATPDLYPMNYTGEPSQVPPISPLDGDQTFGHYPYSSPHKHLYRHNVDGYHINIPGQFPGGFEDEFTRFQRMNSCSFPSRSPPKYPSANMMNEHSYDLPSHVRA